MRGSGCIIMKSLHEKGYAWYIFGRSEGVSGRLVGSAAFKAVEASFARRLVGSIPIHSRCLLIQSWRMGCTQVLANPPDPVKNIPPRQNKLHDEGRRVQLRIFQQSRNISSRTESSCFFAIGTSVRLGCVTPCSLRQDHPAKSLCKITLQDEPG